MVSKSINECCAPSPVAPRSTMAPLSPHTQLSLLPPQTQTTLPPHTQPSLPLQRPTSQPQPPLPLQTQLPPSLPSQQTQSSQPPQTLLSLPPQAQLPLNQLQTQSPPLPPSSQPQPPSVPPPPKPQRRNLTYDEKLQIIEKKDRESSWTQETLALWAMDTFGLNTKPTQATISNIMRGRDKLQCTYVPAGYRSARPVKHPALDLAVLQWVLDMAERNNRITRHDVQQRAAAIAHEMGIDTTISFSKGWMSSFMKRHQLHMHTRQPGNGSGSSDAIDVNHAAIRQRLAHPAVARAEASEAGVATGLGPATATSNRAQVASAAGRNGAAPKRTQKRKDGVSGPGGGATTNKRKRKAGSAANGTSQQQEQQPLPEGPQLSNIVVEQPQSEPQPQVRLQELQLQLKQHPQSQHPQSQHPQSQKQLQPQPHQLQPQPQGHPTQQQTPPTAVSSGMTAFQSLLVEAQARPSAVASSPKTEGSNILGVHETPDKANEQQLFELERQKLQIDLEARHVQLVVEKTLARKRLLDAGIPEDEVNQLVPMVRSMQ